MDRKEIMKIPKIEKAEQLFADRKKIKSDLQQIYNTGFMTNGKLSITIEEVSPNYRRKIELSATNEFLLNLQMQLENSLKAIEKEIESL